MKSKKIIIATILVIVFIALILCAIYITNKNTNTNNNKNILSNNKIQSENINVEYSTEDSDDDWKSKEYTDINLTESLTITKEGTYHITGTLDDGCITINVGDEDKVTLILDNVKITNKSGPAIYVENADKVIITLEDGTTNTLSDSSSYLNYEEDVDGCVYSKDDLTINGNGNLNIVANYLDGIVCKDDLKITGGTINVTANDDAIRGKDSITIKEANIKIDAKGDGLKATNEEEENKGYIIIESGNIEIKSGDDAIHAVGMIQIDGGTFDLTAVEGIEATTVRINGGTINISASDDGINAGDKSSFYQILIEINGGDIKIKMGAGDTDAIDSNGDLYINGGTIDITANSPFDYDGKAEYNGGTLIVNGTQTNTISNQMMGGPNQGGGQMPNGNMQNNGQMNRGPMMH